MQLYTLKKTILGAALEPTLARVAAAGFRSVEFAGFFSYSPQQIKAALAATGSSATGAHCRPLSLTDAGAGRQMDLCAAIGIPRVITALAWSNSTRYRTFISSPLRRRRPRDESENKSMG